jgi:hypothetical protein
MRILCAILLTLAFAAPTLAQTVQPAPQPIPLKPDLVIRSYAVNSPAVLHCGTQTVTATIAEVNRGNAPSGPYTTYHRKNGAPANAQQRPSLNPGQTAVYTDTFNYWNGPCDCLPTSYTITWDAVVDAVNVVMESNEGNNVGPSVVVAAQCP